jgi:hypothetical protein
MLVGEKSPPENTDARSEREPLDMASDRPDVPAIAARNRDLGSRRWLYALVGLMLIAPWIALAYLPVGHGVDVMGYPLGRDFINVWAAPQLAFGGKLAVLFDYHAYHRAISELFGQPIPLHLWVYPLDALPVFWPFSQLPYFVALAVWTFGLFAIFALIVLREIAPEHRMQALLVLFCAPACLINTVGGQNGFLTGALLLAGILAIDRRPILAGLLFGLLTIKPQLGLILPFALVALGAWRVIAVATVTALALVAFSVVLFGTDAWYQFFAVTGTYQMQLLDHFTGMLKMMMSSVLSAAQTSGLSFRTAVVLQLAVSLPVVVVTCWAVRRAVDPYRRALVLIAAIPLISPYALVYDLPAMAALQVWMLYGRLPWRPQWSVLYLLAWMTPIGLMYANVIGIGAGPIVLLVFFAASVREAVGAPGWPRTGPASVQVAGPSPA